MHLAAVLFFYNVLFISSLGCCVSESMIKTPYKKIIPLLQKEMNKMARYTGPNNRQSRRLGFSVLESGVEFSKNKARNYGPGQHGADRKKKPSNYAVQLTEKQKARFMYQISEKQFSEIFNFMETTAERTPAGKFFAFD